MKTMLCTLLCTLMIAALLGAAGCRSSATGRTEQDDRDAAAAARAAMQSVGLIPQTRPPVADLPVPIGFKLVEPISRHDQHDGRRTIDHTYEGREDKFDVERFYLTQMPLKHWQQRHREMTDSVLRLQYAKEGQTCNVRITSRSTSVGSRTTIHIQVQTPAAAPAAIDGKTRVTDDGQ